MKKVELFVSKVLMKLGFVGVGLCAICCILPILGGAVGVVSISVYAFYFEKIGISLILFAVLAVIYTAYRKKQHTKTCATTCDCQQK